MGVHRDGRDPNRSLTVHARLRRKPLVRTLALRRTNQPPASNTRPRPRLAGDVVSRPASTARRARIKDLFENGDCPVRRLQQPICGNT